MLPIRGSTRGAIRLTERTAPKRPVKEPRQTALNTLTSFALDSKQEGTRRSQAATGSVRVTRVRDSQAVSRRSSSIYAQSISMMSWVGTWEWCGLDPVAVGEEGAL